MNRSFAVVGAQGQLGCCLVRMLADDPGRRLAAAFSHADLDIADEKAVDAALALLPRESTVLNAAAFTAVDRCESEWEAALRVNRDGPSNLGRSCAKHGHALVHVSTDYVFDGESERDYDEAAFPNPQSAYGRSKLAGEEVLQSIDPEFLVVRASWLFGPGKNFVEAILGQALKRRSEGDETPLKVVDDQVGSPTYAWDLGEGLLALHEAGARGRLHLSNRGATTWYDFAREVLDQAGFSEVAVVRAATADLHLPAKRPRRSVLDCRRAEGLGVALRDWRQALAVYLASPSRMPA
ncbi:MAG: dTDP-4-dehydrorhamnose reductase [Myxococcota bacterium]